MRMPHGAGDRAKGFEPRIKLLDHVIVAGEKDKERMIKEGVVTASTCSVSGYVKAAAVHKISPNLPKLFDNNRDTVIYNHRSEEHTSELQSLMRISYAVFCLKKKNIIIHKT